LGRTIVLPVAVDQRLEFISAGWIEAARTLLEREVAAKADLAAVSFSLCEVFTEAPPHLAGPAGVVSWYFRLQGGRIEVAAGDVPAAVRVTGAYQAALGYAQIVYAAGAQSVTRQQRELKHRFGSDAFTVTGTVPATGPVRELLNTLHEYMTARTIENPDFTHRLRALGLDVAVRQLQADGYAVLPRAITPAFADELCALTATEVTRHHPLTTNGLMMRDRRFEELVQHTPVCTLAQSAIGQNMILGAMSGTWKLPGPGAIPLHADYPLVRDPYPEFGLIAVAVWALQDWDDESVGPTWVLPGSHRMRRAPRRSDDVTGAVPVLMPKGSALLMSHGIWHWQGDRSREGARVAIHVTYNRVFVRQLDDFSTVDAAFYARNPPAFSTLMGQDDPFGKSSFTGHDGRRFAYAGRFTQT
jgi:hypothetical protein